MKKPRTTMLLVRLDPDVDERVRRSAADIGRTLRAEVNRALRGWYALTRNKGEQK